MSIPFDRALAMIFPEGGLAQAREYYQSLYDYMQLVPDGGLIVEIGVWKGFSTLIMASAIAGTRSRIVAIDPILTSYEYKDPSVSTTYHSSFYGVTQKIAALGLDGYIALAPDLSEKVCSRWDGRSIDFLYIDGAHDYESVTKDCEWMRYVRPGGYAAFDDWNTTADVARAVNDYLNSTPGWHSLYFNSHPQREKQSEDAPNILWDVTIFQKADHAGE